MKRLFLAINNRMYCEYFKLYKIIVSYISENTFDKKIMEFALTDLTKISGQKPVVTKARKSIAAFKIRTGYPVGCMVTLRGARMYEFFDRFVNIALPRVRDFRGVSGKAFDGRGNYNIGVKEQIIFPEIEYDKVDALRGLNISITTTAKTDGSRSASNWSDSDSCPRPRRRRPLPWVHAPRYLIVDCHICGMQLHLFVSYFLLDCHSPQFL
jgi:large subunit ribosomal protein L5